ncbi:MAG: potassium channel family protein [Anaerolineae bacterium]
MSDTDANHGQNAESTEQETLERERYELLQRLEDWLETPMVVLAFVWLALLVGELIWGENLAFEVAGGIIWIIFILNFVLEVILAPRKGAYIKSHWLTAISLVIPALRIFRIFRVVQLLRFARVGRGLRLVRIVSSVNRGMLALGASLGRRGFGYVAVLTVLVVFAGAAGMFAFESGVPGGLVSYGEALWWTTMVMTTLGSQYWPVTVEGRVLCVFLALYALAVFGYVTAALATFFVGREAQSERSDLAGAGQLAGLREEVAALREEIRLLSRRPPEE